MVLTFFLILTNKFYLKFDFKNNFSTKGNKIYLKFNN